MAALLALRKYGAAKSRSEHEARRSGSKEQTEEEKHTNLKAIVGVRELESSGSSTTAQPTAGKEAAPAAAPAEPKSRSTVASASTSVQKGPTSLSRPQWSKHAGRPGIFNTLISPEEEFTRVKVMRTRAPEYFEQLCSFGRDLVALARAGRVDEIKHEIHFRRAQGRLLTYYNCKMLLAACSYGRLGVIKFMLDNGMQVKHPGLLDVLHRTCESEGMDLGAKDAKDIVVSCTVLTGKIMIWEVSLKSIWSQKKKNARQELFLPPHCSALLSSSPFDPITTLSS